MAQIGYVANIYTYIYIYIYTYYIHYIYIYIYIYYRCFTSILNFTLHCVVFELIEMSVKLMDNVV